MSDTLLISTRKGLFTVSRKAGQWEITGADFLGDNVSITLTDRRDGRHYAALDHTGILASSSTARRQRVGKRSLLLLIRPSRTATRSTTCQKLHSRNALSPGGKPSSVSPVS